MGGWGGDVTVYVNVITHCFPSAKTLKQAVCLRRPFSERVPEVKRVAARSRGGNSSRKCQRWTVYKFMLLDVTERKETSNEDKERDGDTDSPSLMCNSARDF